MNGKKILIKKLDPNAALPEYASDAAAGADLRACLKDSVVIAIGQTVVIPTGIAVRIPDGYAGFIFARSGLATKKGVAPANKVGVIDSDYRGELLVPLHNHGDNDKIIEPGERIAQLVIMPVVHAEFEEASELDATKRGENGFGSTGEM